MRFGKFIAGLFLIISCKLAHADQVAVCNAILADGAFDKSQTNSAWDNYQRISSIYCSKEASSYDKAKGLNINGSVPIDDVLVSLNFGQNESEYNRFQKELCYSNDQIYSRRGWIDQRISKASLTILNAYESCIDSMRDGFFMQVNDLSRDSPSFTWKFINRVPADEPVKIKLNIPQSVTCTDENGRNIKPGQEFKITSAGRAIACTRADCSSSVLTVSKSSFSVTPTSVRLPSYSPPPPPPPPEVHFETSQWHPMNAPWSSQIPNTAVNESCSLYGYEGTWACGNNCPRNCNPALGGPAPVPTVVANVESSGEFEQPGNYRDNAGNCRYTFKCVKPQEIAPAPPLPPYCRK
ncbi:MAG: hypothetical protein WB784_02365 [Rhodanobacteraceae bacterium]